MLAYLATAYQTLAEKLRPITDYKKRKHDVLSNPAKYDDLLKDQKVKNFKNKAFDFIQWIMYMGLMHAVFNTGCTPTEAAFQDLARTYIILVHIKTADMDKWLAVPVAWFSTVTGSRFIGDMFGGDFPYLCLNATGHQWDHPDSKAHSTDRNSHLTYNLLKHLPVPLLSPLLFHVNAARAMFYHFGRTFDMWKAGKVLVKSGTRAHGITMFRDVKGQPLLDDGSEANMAIKVRDRILKWNVVPQWESDDTMAKRIRYRKL
jgi:hypothetical protein